MISRRRLRFIPQTEGAECGLASLAMLANYHGHAVDLVSLRHCYALSLKGSTIADLIEVGAALSLQCRALRLEPENLPECTLPCILHWDVSHFVVLQSLSKRGATIFDPAKGILHVGWSELGRRFSGVALEVLPQLEFKALSLERRLRVRDVVLSNTGARSSIVHVFTLSLLYQACLLVVPFMIRFMIDYVGPSSDLNILKWIVLCFIGAQIVLFLTDLLRSYMMQLTVQSHHLQTSAFLFGHLLRLPMNYFERRFAGDILSRFRSLRSVQEELARGITIALVDGLTVIISFIVLLLVNFKIALICLAIFSSLWIFEAASFSWRRRRQEELSYDQALEQSHLIETIRSARAVKLFCKETEREVQWKTYAQNSSNTETRIQQFASFERALGILASNVSLILVTLFGALEAMSGTISVGSILFLIIVRAYIFDYGYEFLKRAYSLALLQVHLDRIADILETEPESYTRFVPAPALKSIHSLRVRDLRFRYGSGEPEILRGVDLEASGHELVAVVGKSGAGKSTLFNILLSLYQASDGEVLVDGIPLNSFGVGQWRRSSGVVMQDDELLAGTILENIALLSLDIDFALVVDVSRAVGLHDEIQAMPMQYLTIVGDMGSTLSGGQRQRLLIARALYKQPKILFLDEGTANLDSEAEVAIADLIEKLPMIKIVVAHRRELIKRAHRVYVLSDGKLVQDPAHLH